MPTRRSLLLGAAALATGAVAGCSGLATTSPVQPGLDVNGASSAPFQFVPPGPQAGASPEDIIRGFLRAGTASDGNYDVARSFLTAAAAKLWVPDNDAVIYDKDVVLDVTAVGGNQWRMGVSQLARIETDGRYQPSDPATPTTATVTVQQVQGQWRIAALPEGFGRWVSSSDVARLFSAYRVVYLAVDSGGVVPDLRWFPQDHLTTRLAKALLDAVPAYLAGTARTAIPADSTVESVPTKGGVATVDLTGTFSSSAAARKAVWTQMVLTLAQLPEVGEVMVQSGGATLDYAGKPPGPLGPADVTPGGQGSSDAVPPVLRRGSAVEQVNPRDLLDGQQAGHGTVQPRRTYPAVGTAWKWLALGPKGEEVAAVDDDGGGLSRWRSNNQYVVPVTAAKVSRLAYDGVDVLWFGGVGGRAADRLWAVDTTANPADHKLARARAVGVSWLSGRIVVSVAVSSESERIAVLSTDAAGHGPRLEVAGIARDKSGFPTGLASPLRIGDPLTHGVDVTWIDDTTVAVIGSVGSEAARPYVVSIGGELSGLSAVPGATAVTTLAGERDLVVTSTDGVIRIRAGNEWVELAKGSDFAVAPG